MVSYVVFIYNIHVEARLKLSKASQKIFINALKLASRFTWKKLGGAAGVSDRTIRDWASGKFNPSYKICILLSKKFKVPLPNSFKVLNPFWHIKGAARKGALRRQELYGLLGNEESRKKGGLVSQKRRREYPKKYRDLGCIVKKCFNIPKHSVKLAELIGIILGDGAINNAQVRITLDGKVDRKYAKYVRILMKEIFCEIPSWMERDDNTISLTLSGVGLVEVLEKLGLLRGNKVLHQVAFPYWVLSESKYRIACSRGLFDTDGGLYFHRHSKWKDKRPYIGWCFTNHSRPLVRGFQHTLLSVGLRVKKVADAHLYMYSVEDIVRYMKVVGSSNPKNWEKLRYYFGVRNYAEKISKKYKLKLR